MIFSIIILLLIGLTAYYHYLQGLFSSAISLGIALIATVVAFGFFEPVTDLVNRGFFNAQASAVVLCSLFAVTYIVLRAIFDKVIPGNVRYPVLVEKIGAPALGAVAGVLAAGILAVAAQTLPFGPSIGMYSRFDMDYDKDITIHHATKDGRTKNSDAKYDVLREPEKFRKNESPNRLLLPVDDLVISFIEHVSAANGSLSGGTPWASIHPDFMQQSFGQRIGLQAGSNHAALRNPPSGDATKLVAAFVYDEKKDRAPLQFDPERLKKAGESNYLGVRGELVDAEKKDPSKRIPSHRKPASGKVLIITRIKTSNDDRDEKTNVIAFGPGNVRLVLPVANSESTSAAVTQWYNEFPIGTMEQDRLFLAEPDDYHFITPGSMVDLVFEVNRADIFMPESGDSKAPRIRDGVFLEFKRFPRMPLADVAFKTLSERKAAEQGLLRKRDPSGAAIGAAEGASDLKSPLRIETALRMENPRLPFSVGFASEQAVDAKGTTRWGSYELKDGRFRALVMDPMDSEALIGKGQHTYNGLSFAQDGVPIEVQFRVTTDDRRAWLDEINEFRLIDNNQKQHDPVGFMARFQNNQGVAYPLVRFQSRKAVEAPGKELTPTDVTLYFMVPYTAEIKGVTYKRQTLATLQIR